MQGKMAVELIVSKYYATEWKRLPQKAIRSLLDVDTSVPITASVALSLGLAPYLQMTPSVPIERFKEPEKIRQRMLSSAFFSAMGLIYREHGLEALSYFIHRQLGERYLLPEIDLRSHYTIVPGQALSVLRTVCASYRIPSPVFAYVHLQTCFLIQFEF
jgi:dsRNA-specific ribonuclease